MFTSSSSRPWLTPRWRPFAACRRAPCRTFSTPFTAPAPDRVQVDVGSSGAISLDIYRPPRTPASSPAPVIVYLPRGPLAIPNAPEPTRIQELAAASNATVVRLNYRFSGTHRHPVPLHDAAVGYRWIAKHLVRGGAGADDPPSPDAGGHIGVCGEFFGGSLAAAMALTECHAKGTGVRVALLGNPIADWTAIHRASKDAPDAPDDPDIPPDPPPEARLWGGNHAAPTAGDLGAAGRSGFTYLSDPYDPFASPLLFFRTADTEPPPEAAAAVKSPKSIWRLRRYRYWPPLWSDLRLPVTRLWLGRECALRGQGVELAQNVNRMVRRREPWAGNRALVDMREGVGAWRDEDLEGMGEWFGRVLRGWDGAATSPSWVAVL